MISCGQVVLILEHSRPIFPTRECAAGSQLHAVVDNGLGFAIDRYHVAGFQVRIERQVFTTVRIPESNLAAAAAAAAANDYSRFCSICPDILDRDGACGRAYVRDSAEINQTDRRPRCWRFALHLKTEAGAANVE